MALQYLVPGNLLSGPHKRSQRLRSSPTANDCDPQFVATIDAVRVADMASCMRPGPLEYSRVVQTPYSAPRDHPGNSFAVSFDATQSFGESDSWDSAFSALDFCAGTLDTFNSKYRRRISSRPKPHSLDMFVLCQLEALEG